MNQLDVAAKSIGDMTAKALNDAVSTLCDKSRVYSEVSVPKREVPAYTLILEMGDQAVPALLLMLKERPLGSAVIMYLLRDITKADPIHDKDRGNISRMEDSWLRWGHNKGILGG